MIILGIDPGFAITGYGVIDFNRGQYDVIDYGVIRTDSDQDFCKRLVILNNELESIIIKYKPTVVSIEDIYFSKNTKTAIKVGHGRGVVLLTAAKLGCDIYEYTPLQVKQAITGYGRADKQQIQTMIKLLLHLKEIPKPDDAADGLAIAVCHAQSHRFTELSYK